IFWMRRVLAFHKQSPVGAGVRKAMLTGAACTKRSRLAVQCYTQRGGGGQEGGSVYAEPRHRHHGNELNQWLQPPCHHPISGAPSLHSTGGGQCPAASQITLQCQALAA